MTDENNKLDQKLEHMVKKDSSTWECNWLDCRHGLGLAASGLCPGNPTDKNCEYYY